MAGEKTKKLPRRRYTPIMLERYVAPTDAINETLRVTGHAPELVAERARVVEQLRKALELIKALRLVARNQYRKRRAELNRTNGVFFEAPLTDEQVDMAMAQEQMAANQPQLRLGRSDLERESLRRAGLLYTLEDRDLAERLAELHNSYFLGGMSAPLISPEVARNNPGYVQLVIRGDASIMPNAFLGGLSLGTPSLTSTVMNAAKTGFLTAGNVGTKVLNATVKGAKAAAPVVTNPRWAATTAAFTVPAVAQASDGGDYSGLGWGIGVPLTLGLGAYLTKGRLWGKAATEGAEKAAQAGQYAYRPNYKLFAWERPTSWTRRLQAALYDSRMAGVIDEWNAAAGNAAKETEFINKYNIRSAEGTPLWIDTQATRPRTISKIKTETVLQPVMEEVPSSVLGPDGRPLMTTRQKISADGKPITESVEREVRDAWGDPVRVDEPLLDSNGKPVMETYTKSEPKLDAEGKLVILYEPIDRARVPDFLDGHRSGYTSNLPDVGGMIFRGPTRSQLTWMRTRNAGRVATWLGIPALGGYGILKKASSPSTNNPNGDNEGNALLDSILAPTDSVIVRQFINVLPDGRVITNNASGTGNDTIVPKNYLTLLFDDEY